MEGQTPEPGCHCASLPDLAAVPMGMDGLDEKVFATVERVRDHGRGRWWLHASRCSVCGEAWLVAQEERIFDDYFMRRLTRDETQSIIELDRWPEDFLTYERVLKTGRRLSHPCRFFDPEDSTLQWTVEDLREERPDITVEEIAYLLGLTPKGVARLVKR